MNPPKVPTLVTFHRLALKFEALAEVVPVLVSNASAINSAPPVEAINIGIYFPFFPTGNNRYCVALPPSLFA